MSGAPARHAGDTPDTRASLGLVIEAMLDLLDVHSPVQRCALRAMLWQCGAPERAAMLHDVQGSGGRAAGGGDRAAMVVHVEYGGSGSIGWTLGRL